MRAFGYIIEYATLRDKIGWPSIRVLLNICNQIKLRMKEQDAEAVARIKNYNPLLSGWT